MTSKQEPSISASSRTTIPLPDEAAEWVLETRRSVGDDEKAQPNFRTVTDQDGKAWWIWKRHISTKEEYHPNGNLPWNSTRLISSLNPYTLERCIHDWSETIRAWEKFPTTLVAIDPAQHRIRNVNTGEVISCAVLLSA